MIPQAQNNFQTSYTLTKIQKEAIRKPKTMFKLAWSKSLIAAHAMQALKYISNYKSEKPIKLCPAGIK